MDAVKLLGQLLGKNATGGNLLGTLMKSVAGGGGGQQQSGATAGSNPLSGLLGGLLGGAQGGGSSQAGGGLLGSILQAAGGSAAGGSGAGGFLGSLLGGGDKQAAPEQAPPPAPEAHDEATIMIRAMCNAAKADGQVDEQEQKNIVGRLGDIDEAEINFLRKELSSPLDLQGFVRSVPRELGPQVYALSVMTVRVDTRQEVQYLTQLSQGLGMDNQTVKQIHQQLGVS